MNIHDLGFEELAQFMKDLGQPVYRADQVWQWLWAKGVADYSAMTNLSKDLRARLADKADIAVPGVVARAESEDGTIKLLLELGDGEQVETVLIPERDHTTLCLSTQVGCAMGCTFCNTATMGFTRNMTHGEILGQILAARGLLKDRGKSPKTLRNLVFMGMGEPLMNLPTMLKVLGTAQHPKGLDMSPRRMTVSTAGVPGRLMEFGRAGLAGLAVSMHAPTQELRARIMPNAARAYPLDKLVADLKNYPLKPRERVTIEYVLLGGLNDSTDHARQLVSLLSRVKYKINLIAYNESPGLPYRASAKGDILAFQKVLWDKGLTAVLRKSKGRDISAACGQLKAEYRKGDEK